MKLSELVQLKTVVEEAADDTAAKRANLKAAIKDELDADDADAESIVKYLVDNDELSSSAQMFLDDQFMNDMPASVRGDDSSDWMANHLSNMFKDELKGL